MWHVISLVEVLKKCNSAPQASWRKHCFFFINPQGVVCQLNEGDDFGKLALVNNALR